MKNYILILFILPLAAVGQIKIGDHVNNGIVCRLDQTGRHGLVMTSQNVRDSCTYDSAIAICKAMGWRLPDATDWEAIYDVTIVKHLATLKSTYYWEYSATASSRSAPARYSSTADGAIAFDRRKSRIAFIAVRKF